jgi:hypothetical protein
MERLKFDDLPDAVGKLLVEFGELKKFLLNQVTPPVTTEKSDKDDLITRQDAAEILKLKSLASIDNLTKKGLLKKHYLGGVVRLKKSEVVAFANQKTRGVK